MVNFVNVLLNMARYYSKNQSEFMFEASADSKAKKFGKKYAKWKYFEKKNQEIWYFKDENTFKLNINVPTCSCKFFYKSKICGHLLALNGNFLLNHL